MYVFVRLLNYTRYMLFRDIFGSFYNEILRKWLVTLTSVPFRITFFHIRSFFPILFFAFLVRIVLAL